MLKSRDTMIFWSGLFTYHAFMLFGLHYVNISLIRSQTVLLFLKIYIPVTIIAVSSLFLMAAKKNSKESFVNILIRSLCGCFIGSLCYHVIAILLGAPFLENLLATFLMSASISTITILPLFMVHNGRWEVVFNIMLSNMSVNDEFQDSLRRSFYLTCAGAWLGAIPIPLDWDRDWQAWPITCSVGAILGNMLFLPLFLIATKFQLDKYFPKKRV